MISNLTHTEQYNQKVRNGYASLRFSPVPLLIKTLILAWLVIFSSYAEAVNNCAPDNIQTRLDAGQSVHSVLRGCPTLAMEDFYGKNFAGGVIVYLDPSRNGEGIVAASNDASSNSTWSSMWLGTSYFSDLAFSGVGSGKSNTDRFCQSQGAPNNNSICGPSPKQRWQNTGPYLYGFEFASQYQNGTYSDWYLPSSEELTTAHTNSTTSFSSCETGGWWSSTQVSQDYDLDRQPGISESSIRGDNVAGAFAMDTSGNLSVVQKMQGRCIRPFRSFSPWIDSVSPSAVIEGSTVQLSGTNFDAVVGNNEITFANNVKVKPIQPSSATSLTVVVPTGVVSGAIRVTTNGIQSNKTVNLEVLQAPAGPPEITKFEPPAMVVNFTKTLTITGKNFTPENTVTFAGGATATSTALTSPNSFTVTVPANVKSGPVTVTSSLGRKSSPSADSLTILSFSALDSVTGHIADIAASPDGMRVIAVGASGVIWVSGDSGATWSQPQIHPALSPAGNTQANAISDVTYAVVGTSPYFLAWSYSQRFSIDNSVQNWKDYAGKKSVSYRINAPIGIKDKVFASYNDSSIAAASGNNPATGLLNWQSQVSLNNAAAIYQFAASDTAIVSVGDNGSAGVGSNDGACKQSSLPSSSTSWNKVICPTNLRGAAWGGLPSSQLFVAVGDGDRNKSSMYYSSNGKAWTAATCHSPLRSLCPINMRTVAWNPNLSLFVAAGFGGPSGFNLSEIASRDGKNWYRLADFIVNGNELVFDRIIAAKQAFLGVAQDGKVYRLVNVAP